MKDYGRTRVVVLKEPLGGWEALRRAGPFPYTKAAGSRTQQQGAVFGLEEWLVTVHTRCYLSTHTHTCHTHLAHTHLVE